MRCFLFTVTKIRRTGPDLTDVWSRFQLNAGTDWEIVAECRNENEWYEKHIDLSEFAGKSALIRFRFDSVDNQFNNYLGWLIDDVEIYSGCIPPAGGGIAWGNVYDANTGEGIEDAMITDNLGNSVKTLSNTEDSAINGGFYSMYLAGLPATLTASCGIKYGSGTKVVDFAPLESANVDFQLPAGKLSVNPTTLEIQLFPGEDGNPNRCFKKHGGTAGNGCAF